MIYTGVVESRLDPLKLGRCQVRIVGIHTPDKTELPTEDLPWAYPMGPITSASISGLGWSPTGVVPGTWVVVMFLDEYQQQPIMIGTIGGIPQTKSAQMIGDSTNGVITTDNTGELISSVGGESITDLVDAIARVSTVVTQQPIDESETYSVVPELTETAEGMVTTFNVINKNGQFIVATASYDETTGKYLVDLTKPDTWQEEQYRPFMNGPVKFDTTQDIANYFEQNFK